MAARATVIIPTYGSARFARWALLSVQRQTVTDIEICIICDGSPPEMVAFFEGLAQQDPRVRVFAFPKAPRTGEPYRDIVIGQTTGNIICYCSHDDLWLNNHIEELEKSLVTCSFTHSLHSAIHARPLPGGDPSLSLVYTVDLQNPRTVEAMLGGHNYFGLTYGAHTRQSYETLAEGWVTTPIREIPTDLYMWNKFLIAYPGKCHTVHKMTALCFPKPERKDWSEEARNEELAYYCEKILDTSFLRKLEEEQQRFADPVVVVFAADDNYKGPLAVSILSLLENKEPDTPLRLFILDGGLSEKAQNAFAAIAARYRVSLEFILTDPAMTASLKIREYISPATYLRLYIPELLSGSISRAIYLDCDIVVKTDLMLLWRSDLAGHPLAAVEDAAVAYWPPLAFLKPQLDLLDSDQYFNSGVMLLDLDLWRQEKLGEKVLRFVAVHPERMRFCDQDAENAVLKNRWVVLSPRWNQQTFMQQWPLESVRPASRAGWMEALENPSIIHFTAPPKPWAPECLHPARAEFRAYQNRTLSVWEVGVPSLPGFISRTGQRRIVAVGIVKNEADIIESFVRYHCRFLDGMLLIDNGSQDNTRLILHRLQQEGLPVKVLDDTMPGFDQAKKVTMLAKQALENEKADLVLLLDADEFVAAADGVGSVRDILEKLPADTLHFFKWRTYVSCPDDDPSELFVPARMRHIRDEKVEEHWKVVLPGILRKDSSWSVSFGNHSLCYSPERWPGLKEQWGEQLCIAHFPVRSLEQFQTKAVIGWTNQLADWGRRPGECFQWERLFDKLKSGDLIDGQELLKAAKEYSSSWKADDVNLRYQPVEVSQENIRMRYTSSAEVPWMSRVLSHFETVALFHARQQREIHRLEGAPMKEEQSLREALQQEIDAMRKSRSWRITAPLRAVAHVMRVGLKPDRF